jgi:hypothetical protein
MPNRDWDGICEMASEDSDWPVFSPPPSQLEWHSNDYSCHLSTVYWYTVHWTVDWSQAGTKLNLIQTNLCWQLHRPWSGRHNTATHTRWFMVCSVVPFCHLRLGEFWEGVKTISPLRPTFIPRYSLLYCNSLYRNIFHNITNLWSGWVVQPSVVLQEKLNF